MGVKVSKKIGVSVGDDPDAKYEDPAENVENYEEPASKVNAKDKNDVLNDKERGHPNFRYGK